MAKLEDLKLELAALQVDLERLYSEGRVLTDCWIAQAKPGSKKSKYPRLKSRKPIFNGKKTEYLSIHGTALEDAEAAIARGKAAKKLQKRIRLLSDRIEHLQRKNLKKVQAPERAKTTQTQQCYTPPELIALVRQVLGEIDLDPASDQRGQQWVQATSYYTLEQDGLAQPWFGRVWLHPPSQGKVGKWAKKLMAEYETSQVTAALLLIKPSLSSQWFQKLARLFPVCFPPALTFLNEKGEPHARAKSGYAIFYLGPDVEQFKVTFTAIGSVSKPL